MKLLKLTLICILNCTTSKQHTEIWTIDFFSILNLKNFSRKEDSSVPTGWSLRFLTDLTFFTFVALAGNAALVRVQVTKNKDTSPLPDLSTTWLYSIAITSSHVKYTFETVVRNRSKRKTIYQQFCSLKLRPTWHVYEEVLRSLRTSCDSGGRSWLDIFTLPINELLHFARCSLLLRTAPHVSQKNCKTVFLPEHRQISNNSDNFGIKMAKRIKLCELHSFSTSQQCVEVRWKMSAPHKISVPKIINVGGNLTKFWQRHFFTVFLGDTMYIII